MCYIVLISTFIVMTCFMFLHVCAASLHFAGYKQARSQDFANAGGHPWVPAELSSYLYPCSSPLRNFLSLVAWNCILWRIFLLLEQFTTYYVPRNYFRSDWGDSPLCLLWLRHWLQTPNPGYLAASAVRAADGAVARTAMPPLSHSAPTAPPFSRRSVLIS